MQWLIPAISIDCGFKFAVTLILFIRYLETKNKVFFWWSLGWFFFGFHAAVEIILILTKFEPMWFVRHIAYAFTAVAFIESVGHMKRPVLKAWHIVALLVAAGAVISSYIGVFVVRDWLSATIPTSLLNGLGFIGCAFYFLKYTRESRSPSRLLVFLGFLLSGIHNLDYPFLRPVTWFAPIGFSLGVIFSIIFAVGLIMMTTEELRRQRQQSQSLAREHSIINTVAATVSQSLKLEEILKEVLDKTLQLMELEAGAILLVDEGNKQILLKVHRGLTKEFVQQITKIKLDTETLTGQAACSGEPVSAFRIPGEPVIRRQAKEGKAFYSFAAIPLKTKDRVTGVMDLVSYQPRQLAPGEIQLLSSIGNAISMAIENAKLYGILQNWNKELERVVGERTKDLTDARKAITHILSDVNEAYAKLKKTQAQLVSKERLAAIGQMAAVLSHELRNVFAGVQTSAYYLKGKVLRDYPKLSNSFQDIEKQISYASNIIANILSFTRPKKIIMGSIELNSIIEDILASLNQQEMFKNIEVITNLDPNLPRISADGIQVRELILNLVINAVQAMPSGGKLTISAIQQNGCLRLEISDTGGGFSVKALKNLFVPFFTTKSRGLGLGLSICKEIVDVHGGKIELDTKLNNGSKFIVSLPEKIPDKAAGEGEL